MPYTFDEVQKFCYAEETWQNDLKSPPYKRTQPDTLRFSGDHVQDGLSIQYFARARVHQQQLTTVPIVTYRKTGSTSFRFGTKATEKKITAISKPVRVAEFDGRLDIKGLFRLTGDFKGWFSNDSAAVPIEAEMNVILGVSGLNS